jgi:hypothetical protein
MILSVSRHPRWPRQVQSSVAVAGGFTNKHRQCKQSFNLSITLVWVLGSLFVTNTLAYNVPELMIKIKNYIIGNSCQRYKTKLEHILSKSYRERKKFIKTLTPGGASLAWASGKG